LLPFRHNPFSLPELASSPAGWKLALFCILSPAPGRGGPELQLPAARMSLRGARRRSNLNPGDRACSVPQPGRGHAFSLEPGPVMRIPARLLMEGLSQLAFRVSVFLVACFGAFCLCCGYSTSIHVRRQVKSGKRNAIPQGRIVETVRIWYPARGIPVLNSSRPVCNSSASSSKICENLRNLRMIPSLLLRMGHATIVPRRCGLDAESARVTGTVSFEGSSEGRE
jgi:hypothetical protein